MPSAVRRTAFARARFAAFFAPDFLVAFLICPLFRKHRETRGDEAHGVSALGVRNYEDPPLPMQPDENEPLPRLAMIRVRDRE